MNPNIGVISVIASAFIAIASLFAPLFSGLINDSAKWKREAKAAELKRIDEKTVELLELLSMFRTGDVQRASLRPEPETRAKVMGRYYAWEIAVWSRCNNDEREGVKELRNKFENATYNTLYDDAPALADKILALTNIASERII